VYVEGELGAGKTAFVRGAARALGVTGAVTSPTFTVAHLYDGADGAVAHLDLSRSERVDDAAWGDLEPYFEDVRAVFVEWASAGAGVLPPPQAVVRITVLDDGARQIDVGRQ
jgi:tRNA threonylcarbamoyladenosine biosynthesis protein TsaE